MKTTNHANDIFEIASKLSGHVEISSISVSQLLSCPKGESVNDLLFVARKFGLWFYTSRSKFDNLCYLTGEKLPTYVVCDSSDVVYEIK